MKKIYINKKKHTREIEVKISFFTVTRAYKRYSVLCSNYFLMLYILLLLLNLSFLFYLIIKFKKNSYYKFTN